jgi:RNA-binding protein YlmH
MKKQQLAFLHGLTDDEKIFAAAVSDKIYAAREKYRTGFTFFLDESKAELAKRVIAAYSFENYAFYGGYCGAQRVMLGLFAPYEECAESEFPIKALTFSYRAADGLTHRDFLGALMSQNIARETVGDILVTESKACVFLTPPAADEVLRSLTKIGRAGVKIACGYDETVSPKREFADITGTVSSLRLDCIAALAARCSRAKAEQLIASGQVSVKGTAVTQCDKRLEEGDGFAVRGYGKFILFKIGKSTKKERTFIEIKKFI